MRLHHHTLIVKDMDETLKVFCDYLGHKLVARSPGFGENMEIAFVEDQHTGHRIELCSRKNGTGKMDHIAYEVGDVDKKFMELKEKEGLESDTEPFTLNQFNVRMAFLRDRNGFRIQLIKYNTD